MTDANPRDLLRNAKVIAVVGCSANPSKPAHRVPAELLEYGYDIRPVNPRFDGDFLGRVVHKSLAEVQGRIDIVDVFRPSEEAPDIARQAIAVGAGAIWLQQGIVSDEARRICEAAGVAYVEDRCMAIEARKLRHAY
ncbi:MAG: CoA-binding protein [Candidatus Thermoplasmatota archaeon]|jgi:predicted CoA-binding protein